MIKLKSVYKTMFWGGTKIRDVLHKDTGELSKIAESWELSTHEHGISIIDGGEYDGKTLNEYFDIIGWEQFGQHAARSRRLPLMIKYIDAKENLSVQVHPSDEYASSHSADCGKNEMWFILGADKDAFIYLGFNRDVTKEEVKKAVSDGTIESLLNKIYVKKGDVYYIPAGTIHAIGAGCLLCEIQQTSDATYRLYDYNRRDENGNMRDCRLEDGLAVLNCKRTPVPARKFGTVKSRAKSMLGGIGKLTLIEHCGDGESMYFFPSAKFVAVLVLEGQGTILGDELVETAQGDTWMLTEKSMKVGGKCRMLIVVF